MELQPVDSDRRWESLLDLQPEATLFHTSAWLRFQERSLGHGLVQLVARHEGTDVGLFPLFVARRGPFRVAASPRGVDYLVLGPLGPPELLGDLLDAYETWARSSRIDYTSIAFTKEIDESAAAARGYAFERHVNCVVNLRGGEDAVFARMTSECRRRIRQAERAGVLVVEDDLTGLVARYVHLSGEIFANSGLPTLLTEPVLADMLQTLARSEGLLSLRAEVEGEVAGMWIGGVFRKTLYALDVVTDRAFRHCSIGNMVNAYALRWSCRRGLEALDFGGGRIPSLAVFKKSFGAEIVPYSNITKPHSGLARAALACRSMANAGRRLLRRGR